METYTIAKILYSKEVEGKYGPQQNVRFTTNETGDKSISCFSKFPLKEGQQITGEIVEKPGTNREGQEVIYHNFNFAKKESTSAGMSSEQFQRLFKEIYAIRQEQVMIRQLLEKGGFIKKEVAPGIEYPVNELPTDDQWGGMDVQGT